MIFMAAMPGCLFKLVFFGQAEKHISLKHGPRRTTGLRFVLHLSFLAYVLVGRETQKGTKKKRQNKDTQQLLAALFEKS